MQILQSVFIMRFRCRAKCFQHVIWETLDPGKLGDLSNVTLEFMSEPR